MSESPEKSPDDLPRKERVKSHFREGGSGTSFKVKVSSKAHVFP